MPATFNGAVAAVAELRAAFPGWNQPEQFAQVLRLTPDPRVGAALALYGRTYVHDPSLPPDEADKQVARACARYIVGLGATCSEDELTAAILHACRPRALSRRGVRRDAARVASHGVA